MNTCNTNQPFFLTANHVYNNVHPTQNVTNWRFTFQAWSPTCTPSQNSNGITFNGSTLRANSAGSDFCLVELNNAPPANSGICYAGWNRNIYGITQTTIIHHPKGDVMKITRDVNPPTLSGFLGAQCFHLIVDNGTTEESSSGAPYFDQNHRIIGQHYGIDDGNLSVCQQVSKYGGRFDLSWTGDGTNATRLSNWLDPSNSNAITTNTTNVSALPNVKFVITGNQQLCTSQTYSVNTTLPITWTPSSMGYVNFSCTNCASTTLTRAGTIRGNFILTATVNAGCASGISATIAVSVGSPITISSNISPCRGTYQTWALTTNPSTNGTNWAWTVGSGSNVYIYNQNSPNP